MNFKERLADTFNVFKHPFMWGFIMGSTYGMLVILILDALGLQ